MDGPAYPAAQIAAHKVQARFARTAEEVGGPAPTPREIEEMIAAAFWASLRREEGASPKISLAYVPPDQTQVSLRLERGLPLDAETLSRLAPAADRQGIHLGVWPNGEALSIWGASRGIPPQCFVLEVVLPGLLVLKYRRRGETAKFVNVAVIEADRVKVLQPEATVWPALSTTLLELAVSMRVHGRGGTLLVAPDGSEAWRESIRQPVQYAIAPHFSRLRELVQEDTAAHFERRWQDAFHRAVESIAGLTAVDGATLLNDSYDVLGFGAKIRRRDGLPSVETVLLTEPVEGMEAAAVATLSIGGTRHLSAAQFAHDQRDARALVASQDGRFTVFAWSDADAMVRAQRIEALLM